MQMENTFILSICIPTWNRSAILRRILETFVAAGSFAAGKVQIVISDNASDDDTENTGREFAEKYSDRIKYWRHEKAIDVHFNFQYALELGDGKFIKLHTDYIFYEPDALDSFVNSLENAAPDVGICLTGKSFTGAGRAAVSQDDVLKEISFNITSINSLCLRRETYYTLEDPFREWRTCFPQVDILLRLMENGVKVWFFPQVRSCRINVLVSRNYTRVFSNYLDMLEMKVGAGKISPAVFKLEKRRLLFQYLIPYQFDFFHQYNVTRRPLPFLPYCGHFKKEWYFVPALIWIGMMWFCSNVIPIHQFLGKIRRRFFSR